MIDLDLYLRGSDGPIKAGRGVLLSGGVADPHAAGAQALSADDFIDSIAVAGHVDYDTYGNVWNGFAGKDYGLGDLVKDLGIRHWRDRALIDKTYSSPENVRLRDLCQNGGGGAGMTVSMTAHWNDMSSAQANTDLYGNVFDNVDGAVDIITGKNEPDSATWASDGDLALARTFQEWLWGKIKNSPNQNMVEAVRIGSPPLTGFRAAEDVLVGAPGGDLTTNPSTWSWRVKNWCDIGDWHAYPGGREPTLVSGTDPLDPRSWRVYRIITEGPLASTVVPMDMSGFQCTETGYHTALKNTFGHNAIDERGASLYISRLYFETFKRGQIRTTSYEFFDQGANQSDQEDTFGWVRNDGTLKPEYTAVKNLISLLADPGSAFTPAKLDYTITGSNISSCLLAKRNGERWLALWTNKRVWNTPAWVQLEGTPELQTMTTQQIETQCQEFPADEAATVTLVAPATSMQLYTPLTSTSAAQTWSNTATASFNVPATVVLLKVIP